MPIYENQELSPKEWQLMENDKEERRETFEHSISIKKLELELEREKNQSEIELKKLEAKWSSWLSIPKYILKLPILILLCFGYVAHVICRTKPSSEFWELFKR